MSTRRDPEATRAAILEAAEEAFLQKGVADASTSLIARRAGVTKSLIHHHFGSKEKLWQEVKRRRFEQYAAGQQQMLDTSEADEGLLRRSMKLYFQFLQQNPEMIRLMAWMYLEADTECGDIDSQLLHSGVDKIRQSQEQGIFRQDVDPRYMLMVFLMLSQQWFQSRAHLCRDLGIDQDDATIDRDFFEVMEKIFFEGVLPR
ncbi:MAG: TetR/AcrR family transcriptional regulator [Acidobacteria bacterium]|nr:TetR/AcrR family transcriptional regulator [Acidobacteriota bacterium]